MEAGGQRQDRRRAEQRHRLQEGDQGAGDEGRQRQRDGDAPRRGPRLAAENGGCIFQFAGHVIQRVGDEDEHEGERVAGDDKNDSGQRIDVEQMRVGLSPGHQAVKLVEQSAVGRRQQFPGHSTQKRRRHERRRDQRADELPPRHIGARHQPSHRCRDEAADRGGGDGDDRGGQQRIEEIRIGEQRDEILQRRVIGLVGDAVDRKPRQRQYDQQDQAHREQRQHRLGPVDLGFCFRDGGDGHVARNSDFPLILRSRALARRLEG